MRQPLLSTPPPLDGVAASPSTHRSSSDLVPGPVGPFAAAAARRVGSSTVRDLLRLVGRSDVISLAGGLPDPATFPAAEIADATTRLLTAEGPTALQYAPTEGDPVLREWIRARRHARPDDDVVMTNGSQQALDLIVRATVEPGDAVVVADPAYVGAMQILRLAHADIIGVAADEDGMNVDALASRLADGLRPRLVYTVSTFHNPTGATLTDERRRHLGALADRYGFLIIEDDPYGELRWDGPEPVAMADCSDRVITLGSFSKVLSPGLRVGYAVGPAGLIADLVIIKQAADLQTATFNQALIRTLVLRPGWLDAHIDRLRSTYRPRAEALTAALASDLGELVGCSAPTGGMFVWATFTDPRIDTTVLLDAALGHGVAFVPGAAFAVGRDLRRSVRLSFASVAPEQLAEASVRLAAALASIAD